MGRLISSYTDYLFNGQYPHDHETISRHTPRRRLDDRIRDLCSRLVQTDDGQFQQLLHELKGALREHNNRLRKLAAAKLADRLRPGNCCCMPKS